MKLSKNERTKAAWRASNELNITMEEAEAFVLHTVLENLARTALGKSLIEADYMFKQSQGITFTEWYLNIEMEAEAADMTFYEYLEVRREALKSKQSRVEGKPNTYYMISNDIVYGEVTHDVEQNEIIVKPYTEYAAKKIAKQYENLTDEGVQVIILPVEERA